MTYQQKCREGCPAKRGGLMQCWVVVGVDAAHNESRLCWNSFTSGGGEPKAETRLL